MKKHPIDDIFSKKLSNLERRPSADSWERIHRGGTSNERRLPVWIWYAAASVAVAFITGYSVWMKQAADIKPDIAYQIAPRDAKPDSIDAVVIAEPVITLAETTTREKPLVKKVVLSKVKVADVSTIDPEIKPALAIIENSVVEEVKEKPVLEKMEASELATIQAPPIERDLQINENRTINVRVEEPEFVQEKNKQSRFSKIVRQLKNVKQGESVNWEDVGFNPKEIVARVDDRLRSGEEKVSEKYHNIKERKKL